MKGKPKLILVIFTLIFIGNVIWDVYLYTLPTKDTTWNYLYNAAYGCLFLFVGITSVFYARSFGIRSNLGKMLLFLGLGMWSFEIGLIIWVAYNLILKVGIPFPSAADVAFMIFYPLMGIGCFYLLKIYQPLISKALLRDSIIIVVLSFLIIFGLFSRPDLSAHLPLIQRLINVYYPMGDVVILSMSLIALRIGGGKIHASLYIFSFGLFIETAADLLFTYRNANTTYWNGDISDLLYTCAAYVIGIGIFQIINSLNQVAEKTFSQATTIPGAAQPLASPAPTVPSELPPQTISENPNPIQDIPTKI